MFWGVTLEPGKRYSQEVESSFHLSMAALEPTTKEVKKPNSYVSVMVDHSNAEFLLCTLEYGKTMQVALDLLFVEGEKVSFFLNGEGTVHLTGYVINDEADEMESTISDEEMASDLSVDGEEENGDDWSSKKAKRKPSQDIEQVNVSKKQKKEMVSLKSQKPTSPQKSQKVDIVDVPSSAQKFSPSKSPFAAGKQKEQKGKQDKKSPQNSLNASKKKMEEDSDEELSEDEWEDDNDDDKSDDGDDESSLDDDDEEETSGFVPKLKKLDSQSAKDSFLIAKNKMNEKNKGRTEHGDGDAATGNRSFSGKHNQEQKRKDSFGKQNIQVPVQVSPKTPKQKLQGGVEVDDLKVGNGPIAKPGKHVHVYYVGKLPNNKEFDSVTKGKPFSFKLGKGEVIKGWDIAIQGMKVGGKRKISIPPHMGYGNKPQGPIPANSTLHFEVELKAVS